MYYHYTSVLNFKNIICNKQLFLSDLEMMNDPQEIEVAIGLLSQIIKDNFNHEEYLNNLYTEFLEHSISRKNVISKEELHEIIVDKNMFEEFLKYLLKECSIYILSLSSSNDYLPMWNYYSQTSGISFSIDLDSLISDINKDEKYCDFCIGKRDVMYTNNFDKDIIGKELESIILDYAYIVNYFVKGVSDKKWTINDESEKLHELCSKIIFLEQENISTLFKEKNFKARLSRFADLIFLFSSIKEETYMYENEVRVIAFTYQNETKSEIENITICSSHTYPFFRKYIEIPFSQKYIRDITLAPVIKNIPIKEEKIISSLEFFLNKFGGVQKNIDINISKHETRW
ncbi:MAG: hypothetical protein RR577_04425 [Erysipelotrichales bacterium]